MRVALNSWPPGIPTGLGTMAEDFLRLMPFSRVISSKHPRFPDQGNLDGQGLTAVVDALAEVDAVVALERPIPGCLFREAKAMGRRTALVVMHEWVNPRCQWLNDTDLFIAPNQLCLNKMYSMGLVDRTRLLDLPLDLERLPFTLRTKAERFVFSNGWGGVNGRKGWSELKTALNMLNLPDSPKVTIRSQVELLGYSDNRGNPHPAKQYDHQDVAVVPSRCEGFGYAVLEPMAMGLPVLATNAEPMRSMLRDAYGDMAGLCLLPVERTQELLVWDHPVMYSMCSPQGIAGTIADARGGTDGVVRELSLRGRHYAETRHGPKAREELWLTLTR